MFQVFYLEDQTYPYHDFILDGYNIEIYEHLMSYFPYPDTIEVNGLYLYRSSYKIKLL